MAKEVEKEVKEVEKEVKEVKANSAEKVSRLALVDAYIKQNPAKYELKKVELEKWVNAA